jgi:arsenate reductase-like glutaredoxin family protein
MCQKVADMLADDPSPNGTALDLCFEDYDNTGIAEHQTKYKLSEIDKSCVKAILFHMTDDVRKIMQRNLHKYKNLDSGAQLLSTQTRT